MKHTTDHKGNTYNSIEEKCKAYSIKPNTYYFRINHGYSEEEALTRPIGKKSSSKENIRKNQYKYVKEKTSSIVLRYKKEDFSRIRNRIEKSNMPLTTFIKKAIEEKIKRDGLDIEANENIDGQMDINDFLKF